MIFEAGMKQQLYAAVVAELRANQGGTGKSEYAMAYADARAKL